MRLAEDAGLRDHLSASLKTTISDNFAAENMANRIGGLYQEAYNKRII